VNPHSWRSARGIALAFVLSAASIARGFDLQGHRGARGLAPENTLIGFHRALAEGVSTLELDIGVTRDGIAVIHHDNALNPNLTRGENGTWIATSIPIRSLDLRELRRFDVGRMQPGSAYAARYPQQQAHDGQTVPTLDELFRMIRARGDDTVRFNIETKISPQSPGSTANPQQMVAAVQRAVRRQAMQGRVSLQSFDWRTLALAQKLHPPLPTVYLSVRQPWLDNIDPRWNNGMRLADHGSIARMVKAAGGFAWSPFHADISAMEVAEAHALGLKVISWTVNLPAEMERMLDLKVDGLITDRPDLARRLLEERRIEIRASP